jgi:hypothetical protein
MRLRIQTRRYQPFAGKDVSRKVALGLSSLMTPAALAAYALGCWRIASDLNWAAEFAISRGLLSRWQVWVALGGCIHACAVTLRRYGRRIPDTIREESRLRIVSRRH